MTLPYMNIVPWNHQMINSKLIKRGVEVIVWTPTVTRTHKLHPNLFRTMLLQSQFQVNIKSLKINLKKHWLTIMASLLCVTIYPVRSTKIECKLLVSHTSSPHIHLRQMHAAYCLLFIHHKLPLPLSSIHLC